MSHLLVLRSRSVLSRAGHLMRRAPLAVFYAFSLVSIEAVMALLPHHQQLAIARAASTNITHLAIDPLFVLPASAFVDQGHGLLWLPLTLILVGGLERKLGSGRTLLITFGAHMLATLISEGVLLAQIAGHAAPRSDVDIIDVGPSYVILAAIAACLVLGSWKLRFAAVVAGAIVIPGLLVGLDGFDVSAMGHLCALILGTLIAGAFTEPGRRWLADRRPAIPLPAAVAVRQPAAIG